MNDEFGAVDGNRQISDKLIKFERHKATSSRVTLRESKVCSLEQWISSLAKKRNQKVSIYGAEDEIRTRDIRLGKATLYHWATPAYCIRFGKSDAQLRLLPLLPQIFN